MSLLSEFLAITKDWRDVFPQDRTFQRAVRQALGSLVCLGRRCLSRVIWTNSATVGRGRPKLLWVTPSRPGSYAIGLTATDLAGNFSTTSGTITLHR